MSVSLKVSTAFVAMTLAASPFAASAEPLRFAFQGDVGTLDPYGLNETFTLGFLGNIYEGLTARDTDLAIQPGLAESWEIIEPTRWRFTLRKDVTFHNGNAFTADDVLFSAERVRAEGSDLQTRLAGVVDVIKVDDHTVDFVTETPNPILIAEWDSWYIMDQEWAIENGTEAPTNISDAQGSFANLNTNGTGPFMVVARETDIRTEALPFENYWGEVDHNIDRVIFQPIASDSTRVAALLSGELDVAYPIPLQDVQRVTANEGTQALTGPELRTIFLGMDQDRDELLYSNIKGANPFKDKRVRQAMYQAIDIDAIAKKIMRGQSSPTAAMVAPGIQGFPGGIDRYAYDPEAATALLAEAGYADGFEVTMDCPNDRYVNDEAICQAVVSMLSKVGIKVDLLAQSKSIYFAKVLGQGGYDTSFYLLGWTPGSFDSWNPLFNLVNTRNTDSGAGTFNLGGYSNPEIDALTAQILTETDLEARDGLIAEAWQKLHDDVGYLPLHQQSLSWGTRQGVDVAQRADNSFFWRYVTLP